MPRTYVGGSTPPAPTPPPSPTLARVLLYLVPGARFHYDDEDYATLVWEGPGEKPTLAQVDAARAGATAVYQAPYTNRAAIEQDIDNALQNLRTYRALTTPTAAQRIAFEDQLCTLLIRMIRLVRGRLEGVD